MKYTPGPWKLIEGDDDGDVIVVMDVAHTVLIGNLEDTCPTCHANASLIAAAPDLLEALKDVRRNLAKARNVGADRNALILDAEEIARVAIAKAKGEQS